jgi:hypothetical protein
VRIGFDLPAREQRPPTTPLRVTSQQERQREAELVTRMAAAGSTREQQRIASELEALRMARAQVTRQDEELAQIAASMGPSYPVTPSVHSSLHTMASDWLAEEDLPDIEPAEVDQRMAAEASTWFRREVDEQVLPYRTEVEVRARGYARVAASQFGRRAGRAQQAFLAQADRLYRHATGINLLAYPQPDPASSLPVGVNSDETAYDDGSWAPGTGAGSPKASTSGGETPSLSEGAAPSVDQSQGIENPAATDHNDAGPGAGSVDAVDYLTGDTTPPKGTDTQKQSARRKRLARLRRLAEEAGLSTSVPVLPSDRGSETDSYDEGSTVAGDVSQPAVDPSAATTTHNEDGGNGPAVDYLDGVEYPWGVGGSTAGLRNLADGGSLPPWMKDDDEDDDGGDKDADDSDDAEDGDSDSGSSSDDSDDSDDDDSDSDSSDDEEEDDPDPSDGASEDDDGSGSQPPWLKDKKESRLLAAFQTRVRAGLIL